MLIQGQHLSDAGSEALLVETLLDNTSPLAACPACRREWNCEYRVRHTGSDMMNLSLWRKLLEKCSFKLPKGQAAHALRHTYASHFMMNGGNILTLQRILGHSSINLTMRYSHLSPDHLLEAVKFRPAVDD